MEFKGESIIFDRYGRHLRKDIRTLMSRCKDLFVRNLKHGVCETNEQPAKGHQRDRIMMGS